MKLKSTLSIKFNQLSPIVFLYQNLCSSQLHFYLGEHQVHVTPPQWFSYWVHQHQVPLSLGGWKVMQWPARQQEKSSKMHRHAPSRISALGNPGWSIQAHSMITLSRGFWLLANVNGSAENSNWCWSIYWGQACLFRGTVRLWLCLPAITEWMKTTHFVHMYSSSKQHLSHLSSYICKNNVLENYNNSWTILLLIQHFHAKGWQAFEIVGKRN